MPFFRSSGAGLPYPSNPGLTPGATFFRCSAAGLKTLPSLRSLRFGHPAILQRRWGASSRFTFGTGLA